PPGDSFFCLPGFSRHGYQFQIKDCVCDCGLHAARGAWASAKVARSRRSRAPVLVKMLCRCRFTVFSLIPNSPAISRFLRPRATACATRRSRSESRCMLCVGPLIGVVLV